MESSNNKHNILKHFLSAAGCLLCLTLVSYLAIYLTLEVHAERGSTNETPVNSMNISNQLSNKLEGLETDILNEYLSENRVIKKSYKLEKGVAAPVPDSSRFGCIPASQASLMEGIIEAARLEGLLDGQNVVFNPNANFVAGSNIDFYYDETILSICWKEVIDNSVVAFSEIKIADASQLRRKVAGDVYGCGKLMYLTEMYRQTNAVVAMNADFYSFRNLGVTCYDGIIYRTNESLDTLFVDNNGDFLFIPRQAGATKEQYQQFVNDNNIQFSIAFGPIMIDNGELVNITGYPIGEVNQIYSRAAISQVDSLHYLYAHVGHYSGRRVTTVRNFAQMLYDKGVKYAYNIDGGQTGELVFNNKIMNNIDFNSERTVSDMIYFATALPEN